MNIAEVREPTFFILLSLAGGAKHGYAILTESAELSDGRVQLKVGTLYAALDRLSADGLVAAAGEEVVDGRNRRYFALTDAGHAVLAAEAERQRRNAERAATRLRGAARVSGAGA